MVVTYAFVILASTAFFQRSLASYSLLDNYSGNSFFPGFDFFTGPDPTSGFVTYVSQAVAVREKLINVFPASTLFLNSSVYIGVDHTAVLNASATTLGSGRASIRLESKKTYKTGSLIIADFAHMPGGICGTWPAFWTYSASVDWPYGGEIDIVEGVNSASTNLMSLHTGSACQITRTAPMTGYVTNPDCYQYDPDEGGSGCGIGDLRTTTFGVGFNAQGGGVYAMHFTVSFIHIWFFPRHAIPQDIGGDTPDPGNWGTPAAAFQGAECDMPSHFRDQKIVFDTTFCGDWGGNVWQYDGVCSKLAPTCKDYVAENPGAFAQAYWEVSYVKVFGDNDTSIGFE